MPELKLIAVRAILRGDARTHTHVRWGRVCAFRFFLSAFLIGVIGFAETRADHPNHVNLRVEIEKPSPALSGIRIEIHETIAPQLVLVNPTGKTLEVLDDAGVAFLRIGPQGVEANLASPAWYRTYSPGAPVPQGIGAAATEPRWRRMSSQTSWGWFDLRLRLDGIVVPHHIVDRRIGAEVGRWEIPVRLDSVPATLRGSFRYEPPPRHVLQTQLTSPPELLPGVQVTLLQGRVPGLFLQNKSGQVLTILGRAGESFLRFGPNGVEANVHSPSWQENVRTRGKTAEIEADANAPPRWETISASNSYGWIEFRAWQPASELAKADRQTIELRWEIPVRLGDKRHAAITGTTALKPAFRAAFATTPAPVKAGAPATLIFNVQNANGANVRDLEIVHEKPMHLLVVSHDLTEFYHIHPELQPDGSYRVAHTFPHGGTYKLYADFRPPGAAPIVEQVELKVAGRARPSVALSEDAAQTKTMDGLRVTMRPDESLRAGQELRLNFTVADAQSGQPVTDLEPYLGALAHFVIISEDTNDFLHAHPMEAADGGMMKSGSTMAGGDMSVDHTMHGGAMRMSGTNKSSASEVAAHTIFPRPGLYKVWAQFQRRGQVVTVPYVVRVAGVEKAAK